MTGPDLTPMTPTVSVTVRRLRPLLWEAHWWWRDHHGTTPYGAAGDVSAITRRGAIRSAHRRGARSLDRHRRNLGLPPYTWEATS